MDSDRIVHSILHLLDELNAMRQKQETRNIIKYYINNNNEQC